jgi:beta-lactam-binding protein with PASTA domain
MPFQPSQHSYGDFGGASAYFLKVGSNLYYVAPDSNVIQVKVQNGKFVDTEFTYSKAVEDLYKKDGKVVSASEAKSIMKAAGRTYATEGKKLPNGVYKDPDGYTYDVRSSTITIYKKSGAKWKTVQSGDSGWDTLNANLLKDKAKLTKASIPTETKSVSASSSYSPPAAAQATDEAIEKKSILSHPATPYVLIGTAVLAAGGLAWYFLRSDEAEFAQPATA